MSRWQKLLEARSLSTADTADLDRMMSAGVFGWPREGTTAFARAIARQPAGTAGPRPGLVPLLTASPSRGAVWVLDPAPTAQGQHFGTVAAEAWRTATAVASIAAPVLTSALPRATPLPVARLMGQSPIGQVPSRGAGELDGPSFGLSFLLALVSRAVGLPVPDDLAVSATIDARGKTGGVGDWPAKVKAVLDWLPRLRRILVGSDDDRKQVESLLQSDHTARGEVEVIHVPSAAAAVQLALGERFREQLERQMSSPESRRGLVVRLKKLALRERKDLFDWSPVARAAELALRAKRLSGDDRCTLDFVRAVAQGHEGRHEVVRRPTYFVEQLTTDDERPAAVARCIQLAADGGAPSRRWVLERTRAVRAQIDARPEQVGSDMLGLLGAFARCEASFGYAAEALRWQRFLLAAFMERHEWATLTHQLSECYRLARVRGRPEELMELDELRAVCEAQPEYEAGGVGFVTFNRAVARLELGVGGPGDVGALRRLCEQSPAPYIEWSARRWLVRYFDSSRRHAEAEAVFAELADGTGNLPERYRLLTELDRALANGDVPAAEKAESALHGLETARMDGLRRAADRRKVVRPAFVARWYPY